ncbi:hypothetical protein PR002_g27990, partial [Phytophthora rubi]
DQWGVTPKGDDETLSAYLKRVLSSNIFDSNLKDFCLWSLSTSGAAEENTWVSTLADVYYYSYATMDTHSTYDLLLRKISLPNFLTMFLPLDVFSVFLGSRYGPKNGFSTDWQPNDGLVNTISMASDSTGKTVSYKRILSNRPMEYHGAAQQHGPHVRHGHHTTYPDSLIRLAVVTAQRQQLRQPFCP